MSFNTITAFGRLTTDPAAQTTKDGKAWTTLRLACPAWSNDTCFVDVTCFGRSAEWAAKARKGDRVLVSGRLVLDEWEDRNGQRRSKHKILANTVDLVHENGAKQAEGERWNAP